MILLLNRFLLHRKLHFGQLSLLILFKEFQLWNSLLILLTMSTDDRVSLNKATGSGDARLPRHPSVSLFWHGAFSDRIWVLLGLHAEHLSQKLFLVLGHESLLHQVFDVLHLLEVDLLCHIHHELLLLPGLSDCTLCNSVLLHLRLNWINLLCGPFALFRNVN